MKPLEDQAPSVASTSSTTSTVAATDTMNTSAAHAASIATRRKLKHLLVNLLRLGAIFALIPIIHYGAAREHEAIERAASTRALYTDDPRVCGRETTTSSGHGSPHFMTFASEKRVRSHSYDEEGSGGRGAVEIAHCGHCGRCSNLRDMTILAETTQTLTDSTRECGRRGFLASAFLLRGVDVYRSVSERCMEEEVGFTSPCLDCWLDDMVCGVQSCIFTCLKSQYLDRDPKNLEGGRINRCFECDEKLCGPDFLACSGTNRRRQGIASDLARDDDNELCRSVDMDWNRMAAAAAAGGSGNGFVKRDGNMATKRKVEKISRI